MRRIASRFRRLPGTGPGPRAERAGFVMALVLTLLIVSALTIAAAMERSGAQARLVMRQIRDYQRHHEMFGVRAIVSKWLREQRNASLTELADDEDAPFHYAFRMPEGAFIRVWVREGQGVPLGSLEDVPSDLQEAYEAVLARLPDDRPELLRAVGPPAISVNAAPRVVLEALFEEEGDRFAREIIRQREREPVNAQTLSEAYDDAGIQNAARAAVAPMLVFESDLWQVLIDVTDDVGTRRFRMGMQRIQGRIEELEWVETPPPTPPPTIADLPVELRRHAVRGDDGWRGGRRR